MSGIFCSINPWPQRTTIAGPAILTVRWNGCEVEPNAESTGRFRSSCAVKRSTVNQMLPLMRRDKFVFGFRTGFPRS